MTNRFLVFLYLLILHQSIVLAQIDWHFTNTPTNQTLNDVVVVNKNIIYAVGQNGTVIKSTDGGQSFVQQSFLTAFHLYAVAAIDEDNVWIVGENSFIYQTNDGGISWYGQQQDYAATFTDVHFIDGQNGFISYDDADDDDRLNILYTTNGGGRWEKANLPTNLELPTGMTDVTSFAFQTKMDFPTPEVGYICFTNGILKSTDSGHNWNFQSVTSGTDYEMTGSFPVGLDFMDEERGIIVSPFQPSIGFTQDGASSVTVPAENYGGYDVVYLDEQNAYIVGDIDYAIHHAADNGAVMSTPFIEAQSNIDSTRRFYAIDFYKDSLGIAVGGNGRIARFEIPEVINTVSEIPSAQVFKTYPNPVIDQINVQFVTEHKNKVTQLELLDMNGRVILNKKVLTHPLSIPVKDFTPGIYLIKMTLKTGAISTQKVILK